ncbi:MAG: hypothetical protein ISS80_05310 [Candidatus Cloacimonetes bacterium]|nr:hypothetical protein [Candidatus Cloacimonadota bacterium]
MKKICVAMLLLCSVFAYTQQLEMTVSGQATLFESAPNQRWLIGKIGNQYKIYEEDFTEVATFDLGIHQNDVSWLYGAARDFDGDDNIEVLYQANIDGNYSVFLRDISTGQIQVQYSENSSFWYYCFCYGYLGNEWIFVIYRYNMSLYNYDVSYVYRSGVQVSDIGDTEHSNILSSLLNYPNPFIYGTNGNSGTTIEFSLNESSFIVLKIFNVKDQLVKELISDQIFDKGIHTVFWNGSNKHGSPLPSGVYIYKLQVNGKIQLNKTLILK